jgi:hypothetical protein
VHGSVIALKGVASVTNKVDQHFIDAATFNGSAPWRYRRGVYCTLGTISGLSYVSGADLTGEYLRIAGRHAALLQVQTRDGLFRTCIPSVIINAVPSCQRQRLGSNRRSLPGPSKPREEEGLRRASAWPKYAQKISVQGTIWSPSSRFVELQRGLSIRSERQAQRRRIARNRIHKQLCYGVCCSTRRKDGAVASHEAPDDDALSFDARNAGAATGHGAPQAHRVPVRQLILTRSGSTSR